MDHFGTIIKAYYDDNFKVASDLYDLLSDSMKLKFLAHLYQFDKYRKDSNLMNFFLNYNN